MKLQEGEDASRKGKSQDEENGEDQSYKANSDQLSKAPNSS